MTWKKKSKDEYSKRDWEFFTEYSGLRSGPTLSTLGKRYGVTKQTVRVAIARQYRFHVAVNRGWELWTPEMQYEEFNSVRAEG